MSGWIIGGLFVLAMVADVVVVFSAIRVGARRDRQNDGGVA